MWVEISDAEGKLANSKTIDISPPPVEEFELRLVIWQTKDIEEMDFEGCTDQYVKAFLEQSNQKQTDIHWRCSTGNGSFNYRLLIPLKNDSDSYILTLQAWDKDIITSDEIVGES